MSKSKPTIPQSQPLRNKPDYGENSGSVSSRLLYIHEQADKEQSRRAKIAVALLRLACKILERKERK